MSAPLLLPLAALLATAGPATLPPPRTAAFALIVTSNRGTQLSRPPLQYADDDGAKYQALFASAVGADHTVLLTELDADTARLFPALAAGTRAPTRANLLAAARDIAGGVAAARRAGLRVRLYFVFAGHGDVEEGRGVLELADGPFDSDDVAALLRQVGATESHVLLDSCNSFFVVNPRRPGGRRFATPRDAAERLARRMPGVGVFLSTSAEAEVFEWSELQSGVFSHAVRSGLLGGADADRDGRVTYEELAAFVETASAAIKNPNFRPKVFALGPDGRADQTFLDLADFRGPSIRVEAPTPVRVAARDTDALRWADVFSEAGKALRLWLPASLAGRVELEKLQPRQGVPVVEARFRLEATSVAEPVPLDGLAPLGPSVGGRGAGEIFRDLFARPFGPEALDAWRERRARAPEPVFGVSREDGERMARLLEQLAASERERRQVRGAVAMGVGASSAAFLATGLPDLERSQRAGAGIVAGAFLSLGVGLGLRDWLTPSPGERVQRRFAAELANPDGDHARAVADADAGLHAILEAEQRSRVLPLTLGLGLLVYGGTALANPRGTAGEPSKDERLATRAAGAMSAAVGLSLVAATLLADNPAEKIIAIWAREPAVHRRTEVSFVPRPGGGLVAVSGGFR